MNFAKLKSKVSQVKSVAASAAKGMSLDRMMEKDEYIHSDGLHVKRREHPGNKSTRRNYETNSTKNNAKASYPKREGQSHSSGHIEMHTSVAAIMEQSANANSSRNLRGDQQQQMTDDHDPLNSFTYGSSDEEDEDDPVLKMMRKKPSKPYQHMFGSSKAAVPLGPSSNGIEVKDNNTPPKKNPNRFFDDLEARTNTPMTMKRDEEEERIKPTTAVKNQQILPNGMFDTISKYESKMDWLKKASPQMHKSMFPTTKNYENGKELKSLIENASKRGEDGDEADDFNVVVSSSLALGDDEAAELERIRQRMQSNNSSYIIDVMVKNRRLLFILLSFILLTYGYLKMRQQTDDSVTRSRGL